MPLTARALNRATLARQLLLDREPVDVVEGVRRVVALQAQEPVSPYVALRNRLAGFDPAHLDAAFASQAIVKATLMRITLHAVTSGDYPDFRAAMVSTLRASRFYDKRFKQTGLSIADADALLPDLLAFASKPRTNLELEAWVDAQVGDLPKPGVWWALRTSAPLVHAPTGGPWTFGPRPSYLSAPAQATLDGDTAITTLVRRYLEGFGPATPQDIAQFSLLRRPAVRDALQRLDGELVRMAGPGGAELLDVPGAPLPDEDTVAPPRLLGMWDSLLLAYADRSRVVPEAYRKLVIRSNGDVLPTVLVDGFVCGVWRPADGRIEVTTFRELPDGAWHDLSTEAAGLLGVFADRDPAVYRRYGRWWAALPAADVRTLPG